MKKLTALTLLLAPLAAMSQDKLVKKKVSLNLTEEYHVLNTNKDVRQGLYMVTDADGGAVVRGKYENNKKAGTWMFYDPNNKLVQQYDYNNSKMLYTNQDSGSFIKTDYSISAPNKAAVTPPVKIGGSALAFLSFYNSKDIPPAILKEKSDINVTYTINVEPNGQIGNVYAEYESNGVNEKKKVYVKSNSSGLLDFIPAKVDGKEVESTVMLSTTIQADKVTVYGFYNAASTQKN
jgi:antitoxin component YwqK of YwqJK toxin-antitoxin module